MIIKELKDLNAKNVLSYITEEEIFKFYLPKNFKFNSPFSSPFRIDKHPSFIIGNKNKNYRYKDFSTGDSGNCFNFVMNLYSINFNLALIQIISDFNLRSYFHINNSNYILNTKKAEYKNVSDKLYTGNCKLQIKTREFKQYDLDYWESYGINLVYLQLGRIFPISHYFINGKLYIAEKHSYAYIEKKDNKITYKIYQPFSKYRKFISGNDSSVWELWHLLPESGDKLIITSSRKDALAIINNLRIPAVSLQAESVLPKKQVIQAILKRFKQVFLLYDNDIQNIQNNGQIMAKKLCNKYPELINIKIDDKYLAKDFSDFIFKDKVLAIEQTNKLINDKN